MTMKFSWPIRVYYEDTDSGEVVYYANYLKFMERARTEMLRSAGFEQDVLKKQQGLLFAVKEVTVQYQKPAFFNDQLQVVSEIAEIKKASLLFYQKIIRETDNTLICEAAIRVACISADEYKPKAIPLDILDAIQ